MKRFNPYKWLFGVVAATLGTIVILTLLGGKTSQVFSTINSGLNPGGGFGGGGGGGAPPIPPPRRTTASPAPVDVAPVQPHPAGYTPKQDHQQAAITAGEIDDNDRIQDYLHYLEKYQGPPAHALDVHERYLIAVHDDQQRPLLDAHVRIYDGQSQVFEGRTYAGGKTLFLPAGAGLSANATRLRVVAEQGNVTAEAFITRGTSEQVELMLRGAQPPAELRLDVLFLLDTTGSMADELSRIQETIDSIAGRIDGLTPRPALRLGLVAYRDRGETYVIQVADFTADVAAFRQQLSALSAEGGGDEPEALNQALHQTVQGMPWADSAVRLVFLVADAPPHLDYPQDYDYLQEARAAVAHGIKIYPIAASNSGPQAEYVFRQLAQQTLGHFIFLTYQEGQSGGAPGESTSLQAGQQDYTVDRLDELIVQVVKRELAAAVGAS
ncbi:MAG: vWA domain-containing protein [Roseiflexaceae bacterium]